MKMTCTATVLETQSPVLANHQLALPQVKTTNYGLHFIRYWNSVQNSLNLNFANFVSSKKFLKAFKKNIHSDNPTIV